MSSLAASEENHDIAERGASYVWPLDREAFAEIYEQNLPGIYSYLLAQCRSDADAADLSQQAFTQALAALPRYDALGIPITAWLFRIARNLVVDAHRRRHPTVSWDRVPEIQQPIARDDVEDTVMRRDAVERLRPGLESLEPGKRDLLALRFAGGLTVPEIATVLNRTEPAIRSELRRILHSLKEGYPDD